MRRYVIGEFQKENSNKILPQHIVDVWAFKLEYSVTVVSSVSLGSPN